MMENGGGQTPLTICIGSEEMCMYTISSIAEDVQRGILAHNMVETCFAYRIVYFVNENSTGRKCYVDTPYENLRRSLENIIRGNLSTTNSVVITAVTVRKNGKIVSLLSRSYKFNLDGYFRQIVGEKEKEYKNINYGRRCANWC